MMWEMRRTWSALIAITFVGAASLAYGITSGQIDDFQDGATEAWTDGSGGSNVANISSDGPAGLNDHYLQVSSGSFGGAARMLTFNTSQWLGNYVAAGVSGVRMDLKNFGSSAIPIHIAIREGNGTSGTPGYASSIAFSLPADGQWHQALFSLDAASLTAINSPQPLAVDLLNVADFRLLSSTVPSTIGDAINARIGVDNITAVPEPPTIAILGMGMSAIGLRLFRRRSWAMK